MKMMAANPATRESRNPQLEFEKKLKRYVHLEVLIQVLERDKRQLDHLKMAKEYKWLLESVTDRIFFDMAELRKWFRRSPGKIIEMKQTLGERVVHYTYRGYQFEVKYLNEFMRVECGEIPKEYMRRGLLDR